MLPNIPAVHISDGQEHSGWLDLNKFLAEPEALEHWHVLYCLLFHAQLDYQGVTFTCPKPQLLRNWLHRWVDSPLGKSMSEHYGRKFPMQGFHPMVPPSPSQVNAHSS